MDGEAYTNYHAGGGTTFMVPASPRSLIREVTGDLFDAPEGSGLIRKLYHVPVTLPFQMKYKSTNLARCMQYRGELGSRHSSSVQRTRM